MHTLFSVVAPLTSTGPATVRHVDLAFGTLQAIHFASVVVFDRPAGDQNQEFSGRVVLEICADGTTDECLAALLFEPRRRHALADLFDDCEGFDTVRRHPRDSDEHRRALEMYLRGHLVRPSLFHIGCPGMRVDQITAGAALRAALEHEIDTDCGALSGRDPLHIVDCLKRRLRLPPTSKTHWHLDPSTLESREYAWFSDPVVRWPSRIRHWSALLLAGALVLLPVYGLWRFGGARALVAAVAAAGILFWLYWRWLTGTHPPTEPAPDALRALTEDEDRGIHNHMASLALLKPGPLRRVALRVVLHAFNLIYRTWFTDITPGRLQGLPTIHFAQWSLVDVGRDRKGRRREALLFLSNYDGSWETYLDDFLEFLFTGVVMIWGNAATFPSPVDGRTFKQWARTEMAPVRDWYDRAYPTLTVGNIHNNDQLRLGLLGPLRTHHEARVWLARLGALKTGHEQLDDPIARLPAEDMQGLLLRGYGALPYAAYALLRLDDGEAGRQWLRSIAISVTDGRELDRRDRAREAEALNIAFTARGLEVLGLPAPVLERFPLAFREGIAPRDLQHRSRILGDVGASAPDNWAWGGSHAPDRRTDVLLMMYGRTPETLDALRRRQLEAFFNAGAGALIDLVCSEPIGGERHGEAIEHFGFVDGLSQPLIEGTWQADPGAGSVADDIVRPGEFILGYDGGDGSVTPGVPVEREYDPAGLLPGARGASDMRDFGQNGTFLVARQLSQHVAAFRRFTTTAAAVPATHHACRAAETVAARVVGRWRSGVPLVDPIPRDDLNAFAFATDLHGFSCPIGAHIRRANPRDSLGQDPVAARHSANRHRLLRRGRPYGPALPAGEVEDDHGARGMMFICLNADIERQFEFVQQNWINNPVFGGLYAERDPLVGTNDPPAHLTVQANALSTRVAGLSRFVQVVGGGYFFLPGMRALQYLARLQPVARPLVASHSSASRTEPIRPSALARLLAIVAGAVPAIRLLWAIRCPMLLATTLVLLPFTAAWLPLVSLPLFLTTVRGVVLIAFLGSAAGWAVMVMLRLILMYGTRVGLPRARWTGPARWRHVLAFQALAVPVLVAAIHYTASDVAGAGGSYRAAATPLTIGAAGGLAIGLLALIAATTVQSLRQGGRPELFLPPIALLEPLVVTLRRTRVVERLSRQAAAVSAWLVRSVPQEIGAGFIDYRHRRLLPGHAFAAVLASLVLVVYAAGFFVLDPARDGASVWVPAVAYVLFVLLALGWLLSAAAFFLDRYGVPTLLTIAIALAAIAAVGRPDHVFEVGGPIEPAASPASIAAAADPDQRGKVIVIASEGYGLASSAWTAEVLTRLASDESGEQFARAVRLVSTSSGAALGATHFAAAYAPGGFAARDPAALEAIRSRARTPSSAEGWWGLVYPDLARAYVPFLVPATADRGWAMEQAWRRAFPDGRSPTLSAWRRDVAAGWRPATAFGVTSVENGEQGLLATYRTRTRSPDGPDHVSRGRDVALVTAARLSASFPYVSPAARANAGDPTAYHFIDGGFWDNSGLLPVLDWIEDAGHRSGSVLLIEIRSSPARRRRPSESSFWTLEALAPLRTLIEVRYDAQPARNADALRQFMRLHPVERAVFTLDDPRVPLTWNLGQTDVRRIETAWTRGDNQAERDRVRAFLSTD